MASADAIPSPVLAVALNRRLLGIDFWDRKDQGGDHTLGPHTLSQIGLRFD